MARGSYAFGFEAGDHGKRELSVTRFVGTEALSEPYLYEVDFFPVSGEPIDLEKVVGTGACLTVRHTDGDAERAFRGIVSAARFLGRKKGRWQYRVHISPRLFLLGVATRSRTFLDLSVPEIVKQVLDEWKVKQRWEARGSYPKRECTAQHRESDLALLSRLLEQEGIWYRFEQGEDGATMVVADGRHAFAETGRRLPYRQKDEAPGHEEHLYELSRRTRRVPGKVVLRDYDFERPMLDLTVTVEDGKGEEVGEEVYEYPGGYTDPEHGKRLARIRLEELRFPRETWRCRGRTLALGAGSTFEVTRHPQLDWNQKLLAVRVAHEGRREEAAGAVATHCETTFFAIAANRPYRPLRKTARPEIFGFQRATVMGPEGEEIHTDRHGRVKLAFHWNTASGEPAKSGWVRVTQSLAGPGFGTFFLPRIGHEVLVSYQGGDPDRPAVIGAAYNAAHPTAVELPKDKTQSTIRTCSSPYSGGFNEFLLEDATGSERIFVHAQKDEKIEVLADKDQRVDGQEALTVGKDRARVVGGDQALTVKQDDSGTVGGNQTLSVLGERTTRVNGDHFETVGLMQNVQVSSYRDAAVKLASAETIGAAAALNVGGVYDVNVGAAMNTFVGGAHTVEVGGARVEIVGAVRTETVAGDSSASVGSDFSLDVNGRVTTSVGKDHREEVAGKTEIEVKEQVAWTARSFTLEADRFSLVVGGKVVLFLDKSGVLQVNGNTITVDGSAISLRGARVQKVAPAAVQQEQLRIKQLEELRSALTFVGISLVDQEGRPVPGEPFRVEFPGGAVKRGVTGGDGTVKVPGSKEGTAKVTFTRLDPAAWGKAGEKKRQPSSSAVAMKRHVVRQGECLASIARRHGASEAMRVYQDPANAGLRKLRPNPHVLNPGDVVAVPQAKPKTVDCQTRQTHQFVVTLPKRKLRMKLRDASGEPMPNAPYRIVAGSLELEGKTDGSGVMEKEIPADATEVELHAHGVVRHLFVAGLNPLKETEDGGVTGVQARLRNLGYDPGPVEGQLGPETAAAIEAFQRDRGIAPTGEIDEALLSALRSGHEV